MNYKQIRNFLKLSQRKMGRLVGRTREGWEAIENGRRGGNDDVSFRLGVLQGLIEDNVELYHALQEIKKTPWWKRPFLIIDDYANYDYTGLTGSTKEQDQ